MADDNMTEEEKLWWKHAATYPHGHGPRYPIGRFNMPTELPTLKDFYNQLATHDWYHMMSDDGRVWRSGEANYRRLQAIAERGGPEYKDLMERYAKHFFSGKPWATPQEPLPKEPE